MLPKMEEHVVFSSIISVVYLVHASLALQQTSSYQKDDVIKYLGQYGHIRQNIALSANVDDTSYVQALRSLQRFGGIKETGVLDDDTKKLLSTPRCGLPDIEPHKSNSSLGSKSRKRRYTLGPSRWSNGVGLTALKYFIGSAPSSAITSQTVASRIRQAFQAWTSVVSPSRLNATQAASSQDANVNINFYSYDHRDGEPFDGPGQVLAHAFYPPVGDLHFDNSELWTDGANDPQQRNRLAIFFYQVALHELGHILGLGHSTITSAIMAPYYTYTSNPVLASDDIQGIQDLFGANACNGNPCQNGGTCVPSGSSYTCSCAPGWTGNTCATSANPCANNPCRNGGTCVQSGSSYTCSCATGWTGNNCITSTNPCANNPCQNGGTCVQNGFSYTCSCATGWTGNTCVTSTNLCTNNPCQNGGTCVQNGSSYTCSCATGWTGNNCVTSTNLCANNPCRNGGTCVQNGSSYTCSCATGWTGNNCETSTNLCANNPCRNGGTCVQNGSSYTCSCATGWTGNTCTTRVNPCTVNPCQNGGICIRRSSTYTCYCQRGWTGVNCSTPRANPCASQPCQNGGTCTPSGPSSYWCTCPTAWFGTTCTTPNPCASNPCRNGGLCYLTSSSSYACYCLRQWWGTYCERRRS